MERVFTGRELVNTSSRLERNAAKAKTGEQQSFGAPAVFNTSASLGK